MFPRSLPLPVLASLPALASTTKSVCPPLLGSVSRSSVGGEIELEMETVGRLMSLLLGLEVN